jgi:hypothetical protein
MLIRYMQREGLTQKEAAQYKVDIKLIDILLEKLNPQQKL